MTRRENKSVHKVIMKKKIETSNFKNLIGYLTLVALYIIGIALYKLIYNTIVNILTPSIQEKYFVDIELHDSNGEIGAPGDGSSILINPMASAITFGLVILIIYLLFKVLYVLLVKKRFSFNLHRLIKLLEAVIVISGVFVAVYKWSSIDLTTYGLYKDEFDINSGLGYYKVEKMPKIVNFLSNNSETLLRKILNNLVMNGEIITLFVEKLLAVSGAMLLPLKEIMEKEDIKKAEKEKEEMIKKISNDIRSQVMADCKRNMKSDK